MKGLLTTSIVSVGIAFAGLMAVQPGVANAMDYGPWKTEAQCTKSFGPYPDQRKACAKCVQEHGTYTLQTKGQHVCVKKK